MSKLFKRFSHDDGGAALIEYALLVALIALVAVAAITAIGTNVNTAFTSINTSLSAAVR